MDIPISKLLEKVGIDKFEESELPLQLNENSSLEQVGRKLDGYYTFSDELIAVKKEGKGHISLCNAYSGKQLWSFINQQSSFTLIDLQSFQSRWIYSDNSKPVALIDDDKIINSGKFDLIKEYVMVA